MWTMVTELMRPRLALLAGLSFAVAALLLVSGEAQACAVCFGGEDSDWTGAFVFGTILMLALPPAIVVGAVFAIYRAIKRQEAVEAQAESEAASADSSSLPGFSGS